MIPKIYKCQLDVRSYELDAYGHVNHANYVSYLEHARWKMLEEEGISMTTFKEWQRWPVIAQLEAQYRKPAFLGDKLGIETQISDFTRARFTFKQEIKRDGALILTATIQAAMVDENGRPQELPAGLSRLWESK